MTTIREHELHGAMRDLGITGADARCPAAARAGRPLRSVQRVAGGPDQPVGEMPAGQVTDTIGTHVDGGARGAIVGLSAACARLGLEGRMP